MTTSGGAREALFGSLVVRAGLTGDAQVRECLAFQAAERKAGRKPPRLGDLLVSRGHVKAGQIQALLDGRLESGPAEVLMEASPDQDESGVAPAGTPSVSPDDTDNVVAVAARAKAAAAQAQAASFGGYEIVARLGISSSGGLYLARKSADSPLVTLKIFTPERSREKGFAASFAAAVKAGAALRHPGINRIIDAGQDRGRLFCASEYVEGQSLRKELEGGRRLDVPRVLRLGRALAEALRFAHSQGALHGEVKPSNVILRPGGRAKLANFGVVANPVENLLVVARSAGAAEIYAAPELAAKGAGPTVQSDIYSLGAVLYHALTGRPPYQGKSPLEVLLRVAEREPPAPSALRPELPLELEGAVLRMMAVDPAERPADYDEVVVLLDEAAAAAGIKVGAEVPPEDREAVQQKRMVGLAAVAVVFLFLVVVALVLVALAPSVPRVPDPVKLPPKTGSAAAPGGPAAPPAEPVPGRPNPAAPRNGP
jgi:hypothetical protein